MDSKYRGQSTPCERLKLEFKPEYGLYETLKTTKNFCVSWHNQIKTPVEERMFHINIGPIYTALKACISSFKKYNLTTTHSNNTRINSVQEYERTKLEKKITKFFLHNFLLPFSNQIAKWKSVAELIQKLLNRFGELDELFLRNLSTDLKSKTLKIEYLKGEIFQKLKTLSDSKDGKIPGLAIKLKNDLNHLFGETLCGKKMFKTTFENFINGLSGYKTNIENLLENINDNCDFPEIQQFLYKISNKPLKKPSFVDKSLTIASKLLNRRTITKEEDKIRSRIIKLLKQNQAESERIKTGGVVKALTTQIGYSIPEKTFKFSTIQSNLNPKGIWDICEEYIRTRSEYIDKIKERNSLPKSNQFNVPPKVEKNLNKYYKELKSGLERLVLDLKDLLKKLPK